MSSMESTGISVFQRDPNTPPRTIVIPEYNYKSVS